MFAAFRGEQTEGEPTKFRIWAGTGLNSSNESPLLKNVEEDYVYFVHSYFVDATTAMCYWRSQIITNKYQLLLAGIMYSGCNFILKKAASLGWPFSIIFYKWWRKGRQFDELNDLSRQLICGAAIAFAFFRGTMIRKRFTVIRPLRWLRVLPLKVPSGFTWLTLTGQRMASESMIDLSLRPPKATGKNSNRRRNSFGGGYPSLS